MIPKYCMCEYNLWDKVHNGGIYAEVEGRYVWPTTSRKHSSLFPSEKSSTLWASPNKIHRSTAETQNPYHQLHIGGR